MKKSVIITITAGAAVLGLAGVGAGIASFASLNSSNSTPAPTATAAATTAATSPATATTTAAISKSTTDLLVYLIEEEKLAHDVYTTLAAKWGGNTFTNILQSESSHQSMVLSLLNTYGIKDPRTSQVGVFINPELQALYNKLIAQGMTSQTEAYKVGVLIEETDIADLTKVMATTTDPTILNTLQRLTSASQSHLAAFQKQL
jgi:hypothetical protein